MGTLVPTLHSTFLLSYIFLVHILTSHFKNFMEVYFLIWLVIDTHHTHTHRTPRLQFTEVTVWATSRAQSTPEMSPAAGEAHSWTDALCVHGTPTWNLGKYKHYLRDFWDTCEKQKDVVSVNGSTVLKFWNTTCLYEGNTAAASSLSSALHSIVLSFAEQLFKTDL